MFTGIIDHCGTLIKIENFPESQRLWIRHSFTNLILGESIALNGICLTVTEFHNNLFCCDISPETQRLTTAKNFVIGQLINLERALQLSSRLGGHIVMGHIDQVCQIKKRDVVQEYLILQMTGLTQQTKNFVLQKGSIAIDGVSLTINNVYENGFDVMLIPHTLANTNLAKLQVHDYVNIEFDMMAKVFVAQAQQYFTRNKSNDPIGHH